MLSPQDISPVGVHCCDVLNSRINHTGKLAYPGYLLQIYSIVAGSFAIRKFPTFCAALVGGYTFLSWLLRLLFDHASGPSMGEMGSSKRKANHAASRFLAAIISAWFSLDILNHKAMAKADRKNSRRAAQDQQDGVTKCSGLTLQTAKTETKVRQTPPPVMVGKTMDLTLLTVTRALDSLVVNLYRRSCSSSPNTAIASSTLTAISQYADTFIFALSSGTVVCLQFGAIPPLFLSQVEYYKY